MADERSVTDMVNVVLARQAAYRANQTGESFEDALETAHRTCGRATARGRPM